MAALITSSPGLTQAEGLYEHMSVSDMSIEQIMDMEVGYAQLNKEFVPASEVHPALDGLGPLYNEARCVSCHIDTGGGRAAYRPGDLPRGMILRLDRLDDAPHIKSLRDYLGDPVYGRQLQPQAIPGVSPEVVVKMHIQSIPVNVTDEIIQLSYPEYVFLEMNYGDLDQNTFVSPRLATPLWGLGYLTAISEQDILARHDPDDMDGDGISGRAHFAYPGDGGTKQIGRFGWVSRIPTVAEHSFAATAFDMGLASPMFPAESGDCTPYQADCLAAPGGGYDRAKDFDRQHPEIGLYAEKYFTSYLMAALPPEPRPMDKQSERGREIFHDAGCNICHVETFVTGDVPDWPGLSQKTIHPFTDLLLHDMGPDLADRDQNGEVANSEFRTAPLWGLHLKADTYGSLYLHDGRAQSALEAVLWHGGEAEGARAAVVKMSLSDRDALIHYLDGL
jgi:CxxC motif-containing protein (DUF1111 family)